MVSQRSYKANSSVLMFFQLLFDLFPQLKFNCYKSERFCCRLASGGGFDCRQLSEEEVIKSFSKMEFIKTYGPGSDTLVDFGLTENNEFMNLNNKNKLHTSNLFNLKSFFDISHTGLVCHKEFLTELDGGQIYCKVCSVNMDSILELSEHLQTKSHEDSIIMLIKGNLPPSLHKNMEFITFYDSNLYCNLCKCNISWSSENPFRTIVDIISHNESSDHLNKKTKSVKLVSASHKNDESVIVMKTLATIDALMGENSNLIDYKVQPSFQCKLCLKTIDYEENEKQMMINFSLHLNSEGHKKCFKTYMVFKSFQESHVPKGESEHSLSVVKDRIFCSCSSRSLNPTVESLLAHVSEKLEDDPSNVALSSELSSIVLDEPKFCDKSILSAPSLTEFADRFNEQTDPTSFTKASSEPNENSNFINGTLALNNKYEITPTSTLQEVKSMITMNHFVLNNSRSDLYSVLNKLENTDFFVSRVSKYLARNNNQVMCDVCDAVVCYSSDEKVLKDSIKHHYSGDKHKNFMEKLTFDEKETIVQLTFEDATVQANKQYIKASGKYLHCMLCQYSLTLCMDHESLQKKLAAHCLGKGHLEEIGKPYNSVFETRPLSSQSTSTLTDDNPVNQLNTPAIKHLSEFISIVF